MKNSILRQHKSCVVILETPSSLSEGSSECGNALDLTYYYLSRRRGQPEFRYS
jgi:hypothetical protein